MAAVNEWLTESDSAFHFMRDNPAHAIEILGSAWGVRMRPFERAMMLAAFEAGATDRMFWAPRHAYGPDQGFLKRYVKCKFDKWKLTCQRIANIPTRGKFEFLILLQHLHLQVCVAMGKVVGSEPRQLYLHSVSADKTFSDAATR